MYRISLNVHYRAFIVRPVCSRLRAQHTPLQPFPTARRFQGTSREHSRHTSTRYSTIPTTLRKRLTLVLVNAINSGAFNTFIDFLRVNGVLKVNTPSIAEPGLQLPRETRVTHAQLRSGFRSKLNSYQPRIDPDIQNLHPASKDSNIRYNNID